MTKKSKMVDNFVLSYVRTYLGVNSPAELVTLAPGLCPEQNPSIFCLCDLTALQVAGKIPGL